MVNIQKHDIRVQVNTRKWFHSPAPPDWSNEATSDFFIAMEEYPTVEELENRWKHVLQITRAAVNRSPDQYHALKSLAHEIVTKPLDIKEYLPTVRRLSDMLNAMDPSGKGSIFYLFSDRFTPDSVWQVPLLRMECKDLLEHLNAFDLWRREIHGIKVVK